MQVDNSMVTWITNYLTQRPQYVRLQGCQSSVLMSNTGVPLGTVVSPFLFTVFTLDCRFSAATCHLQKFSDDTSIVGCIKNDEDGEYRGVVEEFTRKAALNHLLLKCG